MVACWKRSQLTSAWPKCLDFSYVLAGKNISSSDKDKFYSLSKLVFTKNKSFSMYKYGSIYQTGYSTQIPSHRLVRPEEKQKNLTRTLWCSKTTITLLRTGFKPRPQHAPATSILDWRKKTNKQIRKHREKLTTNNPKQINYV